MKVSNNLVCSTINSTNPSAENSDDDFKRVEEFTDETKDAQKEEKISSIMIIFNTWNAMIGVGTVTVPWAYQ